MSMEKFTQIIRPNVPSNFPRICQGKISVKNKFRENGFGLIHSGEFVKVRKDTNRNFLK